MSTTYRATYIEAVQENPQSMEYFLHELHTDTDFKDDCETWDDSQTEAFCADEINTLYHTETRVYDGLEAVQGTLVPSLVARVEMPLVPSASAQTSAGTIISKATPGNQDDITGIQDLLCVKGIILKYIDGFNLCTMPDRTPSSAWHGIIEQAISVIHKVGSLGVLDMDVRPDNFFVQQNIEESGAVTYRVLMIDFVAGRICGEMNPRASGDLYGLVRKKDAAWKRL